MLVGCFHTLCNFASNRLLKTGYNDTNQRIPRDNNSANIQKIHTDPFGEEEEIVEQKIPS